MNNADDAFNELMIKEMEIFNKLMNKKIKIDSRITLESIIKFLKSNSIHTAYLENQKDVHSLFFISENETSFLPIKEISDREFNESSLEEMSIDEFIDIINADANVNTNVNEVENKKEVESEKKKLSAQISYKDNEIVLKDLDIDYMYYNSNNYKLVIGYKDREINFEFITLEFYEHIRKILL